jgi:hypothetical protein
MKDIFRVVFTRLDEEECEEIYISKADVVGTTTASLARIGASISIHPMQVCDTFKEVDELLSKTNKSDPSVSIEMEGAEQ